MEMNKNNNKKLNIEYKIYQFVKEIPNEFFQWCLENKLYKLQDSGELYLVPLWFNEVFFDDKNGNEIIVLCEPELPEDITIDDNKNVYKTIVVNKQDLFGEQTNISISIGFLEIVNLYVS